MGQAHRGFLYLLWRLVGYQYASGQRGGGGGGGSGADSGQVSRAGNMGGGWSEQNLREIAAKSQANHVIFYTAPRIRMDCPYCRAAHQWLDQYGFKYERCDIEASSDCKAQLQRLDNQGGVPYFIVKGQHMKDGFDAAQFVAVLAKWSIAIEMQSLLELMNFKSFFDANNTFN